MANDPPAKADVSPRLRKAIERIYALDGVVAVRVWQWKDRIAVGVRCANAISHDDVLRRIEGAVVDLREPGEAWDFGILDDAAT